jgi:hypothetical protein
LQQPPAHFFDIGDLKLHSVSCLAVSTAFMAVFGGRFSSR